MFRAKLNGELTEKQATVAGVIDGRSVVLHNTLDEPGDDHIFSGVDAVCFAMQLSDSEFVIVAMVC